MQFITLSSLIVAAIGILSTTANAQEKRPFLLRAWRNTRFEPPEVLRINHYVEIDPSSGDAIINKTAGYPGFQSYLWPTFEEGTLKTIDDKQQGYLFPLYDVKTSPESNVTHYQLKYGGGIPKIKGVLYTNFTSVGRGCGGHCGGSTLDYDIGGTRGYGEWYVVKDEEECGDVWKLRWIGINSWSEKLQYPKDAIPVFLWK